MTETPEFEEPSAPGGSRAQHLIYTLPQDWGAIPVFLAASLDRLDPQAAGPQLLVVTADADTALAVADLAVAQRGAETTNAPIVLPVGRPERAARQLAALAAAGTTPPAVAGTPAALAALVRGATLKVDHVRTLVLAWADDLIDGAEASDLEAVLAEVPREGARILVVSQITDTVEQFAERALWRARRVDGSGAAPPLATPISYVLTAATARPAAIRRVLDELDPVAAAVIVASDASEREARHLRATLGYPGSATPAAEVTEDAAAGAVTVVRDAAPSAHIALAILYDLPVTRDALDRVLASQPGQIVALVQPRQLDALRAIAGGSIRPLALSEAARRARARDESLRGELRAELERGLPPREIVALEPLLADYDAADLAAAAVRILERERARRAPIAVPSVAAASGTGPAAPPPKGTVRLFFTVGTRDEVRAGDLVGAIAGEAGITSDKIGRIDLRDTFSLVEVDAATAERVIAKLNGTMIRGRRVAVRPERDASGGGRGGAGGGRGEGRGDTRGPRPPRGTDRGGDRGARPERGGFPSGAGSGRRFDSRHDGPRGFGAPDDRGVSERAEQRGEWAERAERLRHARPGAVADGGEITER